MGVQEYWKKFIADTIDPGMWEVMGVADVFSLLWDFNSVLYDIANDIYGIGNKLDGTDFKKRSRDEITQIRERFKNEPRALEEQFMARLREILEWNIFRIVNPSDVLIIAIDGIPPPAKANQQRPRRFNAGYEHRMRSAEGKFGKWDEPDYVFDTINFTVGTPMMNRICHTIHDWITTNRHRLPTYVKFSDCSEDGEGEHKMFQIFNELIGQLEFQYRKQETERTTDEVFRKTPHVVMGLDSDLCFLSMIRVPYPFYWLRDSLFGFMGNYSKAKSRADREVQLVGIQGVRDFVVNAMGGDAKSLESARQSLVDFTLLSYFIGDDFVPPMFCLTLDVGKTLVSLMATYKRLKLPLTRDGRIILKNFRSLVTAFVEKERQMYEMKQEVQRVELEYSHGLGENLDITELSKERETIRGALGRGEVFVFEPSILLRDYNYEEFHDQWLQYIVCPSMSLDLTISKRVQRYREECVSQRHVEIMDVCKSYISGLQWNLLYYLGHDVNNWSYAWTFPPTIFQLNEYLNDNPVEIPSMLFTVDQPRLDLGKLLFSIINPKLSKELMNGIMKYKKGKEVSLATLKKDVAMGKIMQRVPFYDAFNPIGFGKFFEGQFYNQNRGNHSAMIIIPKMPEEIMFKIGTVSTLNANLPGGVSLHYGSTTRFDIQESRKGRFRGLLFSREAFIGSSIQKNTQRDIRNPSQRDSVRGKDERAERSEGSDSDRRPKANRQPRGRSSERSGYNSDRTDRKTDGRSVERPNSERPSRSSDRPDRKSDGKSGGKSGGKPDRKPNPERSVSRPRNGDRNSFKGDREHGSKETSERVRERRVPRENHRDKPLDSSQGSSTVFTFSGRRKIDDRGGLGF